MIIISTVMNNIKKKGRGIRHGHMGQKRRRIREPEKERDRCGSDMMILI